MERIERIGPRTEGPGGVVGVTGPLRVEPRDRDEERKEGHRRDGKRGEQHPRERPPAEPGHVDLLA